MASIERFEDIEAWQKAREPAPDLGIKTFRTDLETYRSRGHRRLDTRTYDANCTTCIWGCRMPVEMIIDHRRSLPRDLKAMVDRGLIVTEGETHQLLYRLAEDYVR